MKNITRFDYGNTHGWWVRLRRQSASYSKLFSDAPHGGKSAALEAALAWRNEMLRKHSVVPVVSAERSDKQIKTGVTGLYLAWPERATGSMPVVGISVIDQEGRHVARSYSIRKWGLRKALWKACLILAKSRVSGKEKVQHQAQMDFDTAYGRMSKVLAERQEPVLER